MRLLTTGAVIGAAALLVVAAAGCGGDDGNGGEPAGTTAPTAEATITASAGAVTFVEADAFDFGFDPDTLLVAAGKELTFAIANTGATTHTFTMYTDEEFTDPVDGADTGNIPDLTEGEFKVTLDPGQYYFRCEIHASLMQGSLKAE
jgi:plastocyanin